MRAGGILRWVACLLFQAWGPKFISAEPTSNQEVQAWNPSPCRRMSNGDRRDPEAHWPASWPYTETNKKLSPNTKGKTDTQGWGLTSTRRLCHVHSHVDFNVTFPFEYTCTLTLFVFFLFAPPPLAPPPPPYLPPPLLPSFLSSSGAHLLHIHWCKHRCAFPSDNYKWWNGMCNIAHLGLWMRLRLIKHPGNIYQMFTSYFWE